MTNDKYIDSIGYVDMTMSLPEQFAEAVAQAQKVDVSHIDTNALTSIIVLGLGGSGVSGDIISAVVAPECRLPVVVSKNYELPAFVDEKTLVVAVSYSGSTEETISAVEQAQKKNAPLIIICSGGRLAEMADASTTPTARYSAPTGLQPRAAMGALIGPLFVAFDKLGLVKDGIAQCEAAIIQATKRRDECKDPTSKNTATELVKKISTTIPVIYGGGALGAVAAYRFKCDVNENAKCPAYWAYYPELNHNELVGYGQMGDVTRQMFTLIELRHSYEHPQVQRRFDISRELIREALHDVISIQAEGDGRLAQLVDLTYIGSITSVFMALETGVDPGPVDVIWTLKNALAQ
jgi:glucose/mannose-6-phosphate isomerase